MENNEKKIPDYLLKLIEGCSTYVKVAMRYWIVLAFSSIVAISPARTDKATLKMPFDLGEYKEANFYPFIFAIVALLVICFGSAFAQAGRTRKLIQKAVDKLNEKTIFEGNIYLQDITDSLIYPTFSRVAPLAQMLQGKQQFFPEAFQPSRRKMAAYCYYILLKIVPILVMHILPGYALIVSFRSFSGGAWGIPSVFFWAIFIFSCLVLLQLIYSDILFVPGVWKRIFAKRNTLSFTLLLDPVISLSHLFPSR